MSQKYQNLFWLFIDKIIRALGVLILTISIGRFYGPEQFGEFAITYSTALIFSLLSQLGMRNFIINKLLTEKNNQLNYLMSSFVASFIGSIPIAITFIVLISFVMSEPLGKQQIVLIMALLIPLKSFEVISYWLEAAVKSKYHVWAINIAFILTLPIKIFLIIKQFDLTFFATIIVLENIIFIILLYLLCYRMAPFLSAQNFSMTLMRDSIKQSAPLLITSLTSSLAMRIDQLMIAKSLGASSAGIYAAAVQIAEIQNFISLIIVQTFVPGVLTKNSNERQDGIERIMRLSIILQIIAMLVIAVLSDHIINILYGPDYLDGRASMVLLSCASVTSAFSMITTRILINMNDNNEIFYRQLTGFFLNLLLNLILIPRIGIIGAAISTLASDWVMAIFMDYRHTRHRPLALAKLRAVKLVKSK